MSTSVKAFVRPHMAMLVGNHVVGDSRVEKAAKSAQKAGYRVTVVGIRHKSVEPFTYIGDITVLRMENPYPRHIAWRQQLEGVNLDSNFDDFLGLTSPQTKDKLDSARREYKAGRSRFTKYAKWTRPAVHTVSTKAGTLVPGAKQKLLKLLDEPKQNARLALRRAAAARPGGWRTQTPHIVDFEEIFMKALIGLEPDIIHVHDRHPMSAAARYAEYMLAQGKEIPWVYDAHEWLPGVHYAIPEERIGWLAAEAELIQLADGVISVSPELAQRMKRRHGLPVLPTLVTNAPVEQYGPMDPDVRQDIRTECGLAGTTTPIIVYVGKMTEVRGIFDLVDALPQIPSAHLAFVANKDEALRARLRERAEKLSVADRVHIFDYVPSESVTWYVGTATVGLSPLHPTSAHHQALPTKIREYIQAKLPLVVSDMKAQGSFVRSTGIGEVHEPQSPDSIAIAVNKVLSDVESYKANLTDDFLRQHTWEGQEEALFALWHSLTPTAELPTNAAPASELKSPVLVTTVESEATRKSLGQVISLRSAIDASWNDIGSTITLPVRDASKNNALTASERWQIITSSADYVLYSDLDDLIGEPFYDSASGIAHLRLFYGTKFGLLVNSGQLDSPEALMKLNSEHPYHNWEDSRLSKIDRITRENRTRARRLGVPWFTSSSVTASLHDEATFVPYPVASAENLSETTGLKAGKPRILVLPVTRSNTEIRALESLEVRLKDHGFELERPSVRGLTPASLKDVDLIIDSTTLMEYSDSTVRSMSSGGVAIANVSNDTGFINATSENLGDVVLDLVTEKFSTSKWNDYREHSLMFVRDNHSPQKSIEIIREVLS